MVARSKDKRLIRLALPVGSLNNASRGNTSKLLEDAGFEVTGYAPGSEDFRPEFTNDPQIEAVIDKPQNMPVALLNGTYDAAILGDDWVEEWRLAGVEWRFAGVINIERVLGLDYGKVRIVVAVKESNPASNIEELVKSSGISPIKLRTEYILMAQKALFKVADLVLRDKYPIPDSGEASAARYALLNPVIITRTSPYGKSDAVITIEESFGRTETSAINGSNIDGIVESVQTGKSLRKANLKGLGTIFESEAAFYASPQTLEMPQKRKKIEEIATLLKGVVKGRSSEYVTFNIPEGELQPVINYLVKEGYTAKMPTVSVFGGNAAVATVIPKMDYPKAIAGLLKLGADDIVNTRTGQIVEKQNYGGKK